MIRRFQKNHQVILTSRNYREVTQLSKLRKLNLKFVGKHGGVEKFDKLEASTNRINQISKIIQNQSPDVVVSFCSPEASRVAFGLGIKHIAFSDSPHAEAVMRLSVPLVQKLLIPWIIPKNEFVKFGIDKKNILQYKAIDASIIAKRILGKKIKIPSKNTKRKTILIRVEEDQAAYSSKSTKKTIMIIKNIIKEFSNENILVLGRYGSQIRFLKRTFGEKIKIPNKVIDGKMLLSSVDVFVGSGGTMTAESALLGIPTISYNAVPNFIESYLVKNKLVKRETNPKQLVRSIRKFINSSNIEHKKRAKKALNAMEDPYPKLVRVIRANRK
jgi:predicted glycosyltransferase